MKDIALINRYKLLARLKGLEDKILTSDSKENIEMVVFEFKNKYPDIDYLDLKNEYEIKTGNGTFEVIKEYSYSEFETPYCDGYSELLDLQLLCNKHFYPMFRTMVGEKFWSVENWKEYEVLYIQQTYGSEQIFLLIDTAYKNDTKVIKVNEWNNSRLSSSDEMYCSRVSMLNALHRRYVKLNKDNLDRLERLQNESN